MVRASCRNTTCSLLSATAQTKGQHCTQRTLCLFLFTLICHDLPKNAVSEKTETYAQHRGSGDCDAIVKRTLRTGLGRWPSSQRLSREPVVAPVRWASLSHRPPPLPPAIPRARRPASMVPPSAAYGTCRSWALLSTSSQKTKRSSGGYQLPIRTAPPSATSLLSSREQAGGSARTSRGDSKFLCPRLLLVRFQQLEARNPLDLEEQLVACLTGTSACHMDSLVLCGSLLGGSLGATP